MRWLLIALLVVHGLLHFLGTAKAFGWAELEQLTRPVSRPLGVFWAAAGLLLLATALQVLLRSTSWWWLLAASAVLSQLVIVTAWADARWGTLANALLLLAAAYGFVAHGPRSLHAEYLRETRARLAAAADPARHDGPPLLTEADLAELPDLLACSIRRSGAVGRPRPETFGVRWRGRIRQNAGSPWMTFTAEQLNTVEPPSRHFWMDARRGGLPADVLHAFRGGEASMRVRLLSLLPLVNQNGPEMTRAETVTLFNDLVLFAPGALTSERFTWQPVDEHTVRGTYTLGPNTVSARLLFDTDCRLVDFHSKDRSIANPDGTLQEMPWSTPMEGEQQLDGLRIPQRGQALWHPPGADPFVYIEADITGHRINGPLEDG